MKYPFSVIGRPDDTKGIFWVDNDNFQATYQVTNYLIERGHSKIAFIGGPFSMNVTRDRFEGYRRALSVHGLQYDEELIQNQVDFSSENGYKLNKHSGLLRRI